MTLGESHLTMILLPQLWHPTTLLAAILQAAIFPRVLRVLLAQVAMRLACFRPERGLDVLAMQHVKVTVLITS